MHHHKDAAPVQGDAATSTAAPIDDADIDDDDHAASFLATELWNRPTWLQIYISICETEQVTNTHTYTHNKRVQ